MSLLELHAVSRAFGGLLAVNQVHMSVNQGEIVGLIGPNGAGKTTLFRLIAGVYPPSAGRILFDDESIGGLPAHRICKKGLVSTHQVVRPFPALTVLENVLVGAHYGRAHAGDARQRAWEVLEFTGLAHRAGLSASQLTLPDRKRLEVARALATVPRLLLLDEVMAGLNPTETARTMELVRAVRERGTTVLMIEHNMRAIMGLSDRIVVLHHGEKIADGAPQEIARDPRVVEAYLGESLISA